MHTIKILVAFLLTASFLGACKKSPTCQLNEPAPVFKWSVPIEAPDERLTNFFIHGNELYYGIGLNNPQLVTVNTLDGSSQFSPAWEGLDRIDNFYVDGDYLYWNYRNDIWRRNLAQQYNEKIGAIGYEFTDGYNEGHITPFEGLAAGYFHEGSMADRDYAIGLYDMASQQELFRYQVNDPQVVTNLGDPAIGRTSSGDTVITFVEMTKKNLMIFNLSQKNTLQIPLPDDDLYFPTLRNIHIRNGRVFLALRFRVFCFDASTGAKLWELQEGEKIKGSILRFWDDRLIFHSNSGILMSLDPNTGQILWQNEPDDSGASDQVLIGNILYYSTNHLDPDILGIDLSDGCMHVHLVDPLGPSGGIIGVSSNGTLLLGSADLIAYKL
jgi:hypothetical protein